MKDGKELQFPIMYEEVNLLVDIFEQRMLVPGFPGLIKVQEKICAARLEWSQ